MKDDAFPYERLRAARERAGYVSAAAFAEANELTESTYRSHENGVRKFPQPTAKTYAALLNVEWQWLLFGDEAGQTLRLGFEPRDEAVKQDLIQIGGLDYAMVALYDLRLSAGPGAWVGDRSEPLHYEPFRSQWLRSLTNTPPEKLILARVDGDSMETTLHNGDQVLIDLVRNRPGKDGIYGLRHREDLIVKRLSVDLRSGRLTIISDNPRYPTYPDVNPDDLDVIGRVVWLGRQV